MTRLNRFHGVHAPKEGEAWVLAVAHILTAMALGLVLVLAPPNAAAFGLSENTYPVEVLRVKDGDTYLAEITTLRYPKTKVEISVRVDGIDTPESKHRAKCDEERELAVLAKSFTYQWLLERSGKLWVTEVRKGKWADRVIAMTVDEHGNSLKDAILAAGHGRPYQGKKRGSWCPVAGEDA
jgi:micrococcal nuclease